MYSFSPLAQTASSSARQKATPSEMIIFRSVRLFKIRLIWGSLRPFSVLFGELSTHNVHFLRSTAVLASGPGNFELSPSVEAISGLRLWLSRFLSTSSKVVEDFAQSLLFFTLSKSRHSSGSTEPSFPFPLYTSSFSIGVWILLLPTCGLELRGSAIFTHLLERRLR